MKNKRGAPRGNKNALKHGFYSRSFTNAEKSDLDENSLGQFKDEIPLLRVLVARTAQSLNEEHQNLSFEDRLTALRTITFAIGRLESLTRTNRVYFGQLAETEMVIEQAKEELLQKLGFPNSFNADISHTIPREDKAASSSLPTPPPDQKTSQLRD